MAHRRVVVTGMGLVTALGETVDAFWNNLVAGTSGVRRISLFDPSRFDSQIGGECTNFKAEEYFDRKAAKRLDRFAQFALAAAEEAARSSGIESDGYNGDRRRMGAILGSGIGGLMEIEEQHLRLLEKGAGKVSAFTIPKLMANAASANIAIEYDIQGISASVGTACASAGHAMYNAFTAIRLDQADLVITGGAEAALTHLGLGAFCSMKALSRRNDSPETASRPFDRDRDGFILGEGAGILVFEELGHARKRSATIWAEILGFGATTDATHVAQPADDGAGAAEAMRVCLKNAGAIATIMSIRNSTGPPTLNLETPGEGCDLDYVPQTARDLRIDRAISNSFGFGGHNLSVLIGRFE